MRTQKDRIRHAITFEVIGLILVIPLGSLVLGFHAGAIGLLAVLGSLAATVWTYAFTLAFDKALLKWRGTTARTVPLRILYVVCFELGLMAVLVPVTALALGVGLIEALLIDIGFAAFYVVYAFIYNLIYDAVFPDPGATSAPISSSVAPTNR